VERKSDSDVSHPQSHHDERDCFCYGERQQDELVGFGLEAKEPEGR